MKNLALLTLLLICFSCSDIEEIDCPDEAFEYLESFKIEAKKRGIPLNSLNGLKIELRDGITDPVHGKVNGLYIKKRHIILIDTSGEVWKVQPEELLSHELGHAVLKREHLIGVIPGTWVRKSIMGNLGAIPLFCNEKYAYRRDYYYDELFYPNTDTPSWAKD